MKSFATLCLLAIATAVQLQDKGSKDRDVGCERPRPCAEDIDEQGLNELGEGIVAKVKDMARDGGKDEEGAQKRGDEAASDLERWVKEGKSCEQIKENIKEQATKEGVSKEDIERNLGDLDDAAEKVMERSGERKQKEGLAQKRRDRQTGGRKEDDDESDGMGKVRDEIEGKIKDAIKDGVKDGDITKEDAVNFCKKVLSGDEGTGPSGPSGDDEDTPPSMSEDDQPQGEPSRNKMALGEKGDKIGDLENKVEEELGGEVAKKVKEEVKDACRRGKAAMKKRAKKEAEGDDDKQGGRGDK